MNQEEKAGSLSLTRTAESQGSARMLLRSARGAGKQRDERVRWRERGGLTDPEALVRVRAPVERGLRVEHLGAVHGGVLAPLLLGVAPVEGHQPPPRRHRGRHEAL